MATKMDTGSEDIVSEINITPFVDVMLVLLVIFMISAPAVYSNTLKVQTPVATQASKAGVDDHITLTLNFTETQSVEVEGRKLDFTQLKDFIEKVKKADPMVDVVLNADGRLTHSDVLSLVDLLKGSGIENVAFGVQKK